MTGKSDDFGHEATTDGYGPCCACGGDVGHKLEDAIDPDWFEKLLASSCSTPPGHPEMEQEFMRRRAAWAAHDAALTEKVRREEARKTLIHSIRAALSCSLQEAAEKADIALNTTPQERSSR